jgi:gliding motility-associated-like protein
MKIFITYLFIIGAMLLLSATLMAQPVASFTSDVSAGCNPIVVHFTDQTTDTPTSWNWDLGNNTTSNLQNPSTTYITSGVFTVTLIATNAHGSDTATGTITVYPSPTVGFIGDSTLSCPPKTASFTNLVNPNASGTTSYTWDFGDGHTSNLANPTHTYTAVGNFSVTLIATNSTGCITSFTKSNYIPIIAKPTTNFSCNNTWVCYPPDTVTFSNTTLNGTAYRWDFGDGQTSTQANPVHVYTSKGTYTVRLIATNTSGCEDTTIKPGLIKVGVLDANFTMSTSTVCAKRTITFTNTTNIPGATLLWLFGDGGSSTQTTPTYPYLFQGMYPAQLIASYNGCNDTELKGVTVIPGPTVRFSTNNTAGCGVPYNVTFSNTTTGATSYLWLFGDGTTSNQANPTHAYQSFGTYTVKLIATSANGCFDTLTKGNLISIVQPLASISNTPQGCAPSSITFTGNTNSSSPVTNYAWDFGDGSSIASCFCQTQSHNFTIAGNDTVTLTVTNAAGCSWYVKKVMTISVKPTAYFTMSATTICPKSPLHLINGSTGATHYEWTDDAGNFSINTNPIFYYNDPGVHKVTLIAEDQYNNSCRDTFERMDTVLMPRAKFVASYVCSNRLEIFFTDSSLSADSYYWDFGDGVSTTQAGSVSHTYNSYGNYQVRFAVQNNNTGCTDTMRYTLKLMPVLSNFNASDTTLCPGDSTVFSAVAASMKKRTFIWDFGDGYHAVNDSSIVSHTYSAPGYFTVKLLAVDTAGCWDSLTKTNFVDIGGASIDFTGTPAGGCLPLNVSFQDQSSPNGGFSIVSRTWSFGDGGNATSANPSHTYMAINKYTVTLMVKDANNCTAYLAKSDYINVSKPVVQFTSADTNTCKGTPVSFNNLSSNSASYLWRFGDGDTSTQVNPVHTYNSPNDFIVTLVAADSFGCKDSLTKIRFIHTMVPALAYTLSDTAAPCPPLIVSFNNTSVGCSGYVWSFGNNSQSTLTSPTATYTYPGIYIVKLIGQNTYGCKDSVFKAVHIYGPTATFSYTNKIGCLPLTVNFSTASLNVASFIWDMNNGVTQSTTAGNFSYTYTQRGKYLPKLVLTDNASCLVPIQGIDTIFADNVDADFSFSPGLFCDTGTIQFKDTLLGTITPITGRTWLFGDGGTSTAQSPSHKYTLPNAYQVRLTMANAMGCIDTVYKNVNIYPVPQVSGGNNQAMCFGDTTHLVMNASGAVTYTWSPATGLSCTACASPSVLPTSSISYTVTGIAANGCSDTGLVTLTVNQIPVITVSKDTSLCHRDSIALQANGAAAYNWTPSKWLTCNTCSNPVAAPDTTIMYKVKGTTDGCSDSAYMTISILPLPEVIASNNSAICKGDSTLLHATGAVNYSWFPPAGLSCTQCPDPIANPLINTTYIVKGTDSIGCVNADTVVLTVNKNPVVHAAEPKTICEGSFAQLTATGALTYTWSPAVYLSCANCDAPSANPDTTTTFSVVGVDFNGCKAQDTVTISVINKLPTYVDKGDSICMGDTVRLSASGGTGYLWSPAIGITNAQDSITLATPVENTLYTVYIKQGNCFTDTGHVYIVVHDTPTVDLGPDVTVYSGNVTALNAVGVGITTYEWSNASSLSCKDCASPVASPQKTTRYTVKVSNEWNCVSQDDILVKIACDKNQIFLANTFTPNGDGINDRFYPQGAGDPIVKKLTIVNRWGNVVFDATDIPINDPAYGWDGTYKLAQLPPDVFIYVLKATCESGQIIEIKGDVSIVR